MRIRIITIHGIPNFGSVFQSYGLCEYLKQTGYEDVRVIDYNPDYYNRRGLKAFLGKLLNYKNYVVRKKKFRSFVEKNIPLTEKGFKTSEELKNYDFDADVYVAGGDQLWNVFHRSGNDGAYRLAFAKGKKISYATSMGQKDFPHNELMKLCEDIKDFSSVSVRERSSVGLLEKGGIHATHCVDPVFLLEKEDYEKFIKPVKQPKYLMVYLVTPSPLLEKTINYLKEKYNLKVILCGGFSKKCTCDEFLKDLGPDEILSYIKNAEIVLSSSFHATSFSIIFEKQFFTILPDEHTNERIEDLLNQFELSHRIISDNSEFETALNDVIDYNSVKPYSSFTGESKKYLREALADD